MPDNTLITRRNFLLLSAAAIAIAGCQAEPKVLKLTGPAMGTSYSIIAIDKSGTLTEADIRDSIETELKKVNDHLSNWDPNSEISRFNKSPSTETISVSPMLAEVMQAAQEIHVASEGQFDVTLGPLIDLWGFGAKDRELQTPTDLEIAEALKISNQSQNLSITDQTLQKHLPDTSIYLSAIGKGYGVDVLARKLAELGIKDYMVEIGGDLYTAGKNPQGQPWKIGVETPNALDRSTHQVVDLSNLGMATSGDYRNYFEKDGQRYSHILDAQTGRPITHRTASVTVLAENAMLADGWATAMLVLGRERGLKIANQLDMAVLFIERDAQTTHTKFITTPSNRFTALQVKE
ncbi:FAD:protein FMN transferase [Curvivirga aplysinae]|uniref:FAD:protein FMN transferase n=1 Tax=Curvivirga aplysinae TaxID=2529852 RepID=UPI001C3FAC96|nr:FAD:protein FMN transferase [Curvivirga aplysinae]